MKLIKKNAGFFVLTIVYIFTFLCMLPLRNQAFQDDWAYMQTTRNYYVTGNLKLSDWQSSSFIFQAFWGNLFAKIAGGFSMKIMQLSTVVLFYFGLVGFYLLLKKLKIGEVRSLVFTFFLMSFPWVFQFTYSYLTDVPYISLMILSMYFYLRGLSSTKYIFLMLLLGSIFGALSFLVRQLGIVLPISMFLVLTYKSYIEKKPAIKYYLASIFPFVIAYLVYSHWLSTSDNLTLVMYQVSQHFKLGVLPYLLPIKPDYASVSDIFYGEYLKRIFFYIEIAAGFLLPIFLIFKYNKHNILMALMALKRYKKAIIITALVYLVLLFTELLFHFGRKEFRLELPSLIVNFDTLSHINWQYSWKYFVAFALFILIPLFAATIQKIFRSIFTRRKDLKMKVIVKLIFATALLTSFRFIYEFISVFKYRVHLGESLISTISIYLKSIFSQEGTLIFNKNWFAFIVIFTVVSATIYLFNYYKIKFDKRLIRIDLSFLILSFVMQALIIVFFMYFSWGQYIISFIPFILIWIAYLTRGFKISYIKTVMTISILLLFSVSVTKTRYEKNGISWELATSLVNKGVAPVDIYVPEESWMPWWYYESTLKEEVAKYNGNKYLLDHWNTWRDIKPTSNVHYSYKEVPLDYDPASDTTIKVLVDTGIQYTGLFSKKRYIAFEKLD